MLRVALINMPFAAVQLPSIALTQLAAVVEASAVPARVEIHHFNLSFARFLGLPTYRLFSDSVEANTSGLGDWFFRRMAFPEAADGTETYLVRHFSANRELDEKLRRKVVPRRGEAEAFLDELIESRGLASCDVVGLTSMFSQNVASFSLARKVKERNPRVVTVMGGANCESPMGQVLARKVPAVDFVFSGPALGTFPRFLQLLAAGKEAECHRIPGVLSRRKLALSPLGDGPELGEELDIDEAVPLRYEGYFADLEAEGLAEAVEPNILFETSRGCWWGERSHCTFCGLNGRTLGYRAMAPERALDQFRELFRRYGHRSRIFQAVDNILPREYFREVLPHLEPPPEAYLFYEIKADIKEQEARTLSEARVHRLQPGIEALATSTLKLMGKGTSAFQNLRFLDYCLRYGLEPVWNLLIGFPGEEEAVYEKYLEDLPRLVHLPPPTGVYPVRFDRFSPYFSEAEKYGLDLRPCDFYGMIYPFDEKDLSRLAYFFTDHNFAAGFAANTARWIGALRREVERWQRRFFRQDGGAGPELRLLETPRGAAVFDSRDGSPREVPLSAVQVEVLEALASQTKVARLVRALPELGAERIESEVETLRHMDLIFEEGDLLMSLVGPRRRPAAADLAAQGAAAPGETAGELPANPT